MYTIGSRNEPNKWITEYFKISNFDLNGVFCVNVNSCNACENYKAVTDSEINCTIFSSQCFLLSAFPIIYDGLGHSWLHLLSSQYIGELAQHCVILYMKKCILAHLENHTETNISKCNTFPCTYWRRAPMKVLKIF